MKWENNLMAYEEDIKSRGFWDWIKAHTSFMWPLRRYEGILEPNEQNMKFLGRDLKGKKDFDPEVEIGNITGIHFG